MNVTSKDLRFHTKEILNSVERGEEVIITYRGKPKAKLVTVKKIRKKNKHDEIFGIWKDNDQTIDVNQYVRKIRRGRFNAG
jgi:prevent-host-death family protein